MWQKFIAVFLFIAFSPLLLSLFIAMKLTSKDPVIFKQKRVGKDKKIFTIYKVRTMITNAEGLKQKYRHLNEADGPVFKIKNDPRYTKVGKFLAHTGIDELPQLINVLKGEMALVGPRPLPINEAKKVPEKYQGRFAVLPGITSPWVIKGSHRLKFNEWMESDLRYIRYRSAKYDIQVLQKTLLLIFQAILSKLSGR